PPLSRARTGPTAPAAAGAGRTAPAYRSPSDAVAALGHAARYATWLESDDGAWVRPTGTDLARAARLVDALLGDATAAGGAPGLELDDPALAELLGAAGLPGPRPAGDDGVACVLRAIEDRLFGPVVSFGVAGDASELLGDVAYGIAPLTTGDVARLVRTVRAAPRLFGYRGSPPLDVAALEDVVGRSEGHTSE